MSADFSINIVVAVIFFVIYIIIKIAKAAKGPPANNRQPPPQQNFSNPFQQNPPQNQNPFQQQNPFQPNPPSIPNPFSQIPRNPNPSNEETDMDSFFDDKKDAFSQASTRNDHSNMGVGSQSFYCNYCGKKFTNIEVLKRDTCFKHPKSDQGLQKHVLYKGQGRPNVGF